MTVSRALNLVNIWGNFCLFSAVDSLRMVRLHSKKHQIVQNEAK